MVSKWFLLVCLGLFNLWDVLATWLILDGGGRELNPFVGFLLAHIGYFGLLVVKGGFITMLAIWINEVPIRLLLGITLIYFGLVVYQSSLLIGY